MKKRDKKKRLRKKREKRERPQPVARILRVDETPESVRFDAQVLPTPAGERFFDLLKKQST